MFFEIRKFPIVRKVDFSTNSGPDVDGQHCPCLFFIRIFRKILFGVCLLSGFCPLSVCPDFKEKGCLVSVGPDFFYVDSVRCRDFVWIFKKTLSVVCLSGRTRTRQNCPDFCCPCPPTSALDMLVRSSFLLHLPKNLKIDFTFWVCYVTFGFRVVFDQHRWRSDKTRRLNSS